MLSTRNQHAKRLVLLTIIAVFMLSVCIWSGLTPGAYAANSTVTIKLSGGSIRTAAATDVEPAVFSSDDVTVSVAEGTITFSHDFVQGTLFPVDAPYLKVDVDGTMTDYYPVSTVDGETFEDKGWWEGDHRKYSSFETPVLKGLYMDANSNGELDEGETLYRSGDSMTLNGDVTLTCYYDNGGMTYGIGMDMSTNPDSTDPEPHYFNYKTSRLVKAWDGFEVTFTESGGYDKENMGNYPTLNEEPVNGEDTGIYVEELVNYTARELQTFYHRLTTIGWNAFSPSGVSGDHRVAVGSVELPTTVNNIQDNAFNQLRYLTQVSGLEGLIYMGPAAFHASGVTQFVFSDKLNRINGDYALTAPAESKAIIFDSFKDFIKFQTKIGVDQPAAGDSKAAIYVAKGKSQEFLRALDNLDVFTTVYNGDNAPDPAIPLPLREFYKATFKIDGVVVSTQYQDAGAVAEIELEGEDVFTNTTPTAADASLLPLTMPSAPEIAGKVFVGWMDEDGNLWAEDSFGGLGELLTGDTVFTPHYVMPAIVTFDSQGGSAVAAVNTGIGETITAPPAPTRTGFDFAGWYKQAGHTDEWVFESDTVENAETTLYAKWTVVTYDVTYVLDGGTNGANPVTYTVESAAVTLAAPTKEGFAFEGWYDNDDFTGTAVTTIPAGSTGDITLYAKWKKESTGGCNGAAVGSAALLIAALGALFVAKKTLIV